MTSITWSAFLTDFILWASLPCWITGFPLPLWRSKMRPIPRRTRRLSGNFGLVVIILGLSFTLNAWAFLKCLRDKSDLEARLPRGLLLLQDNPSITFQIQFHHRCGIFAEYDMADCFTAEQWPFWNHISYAYLSPTAGTKLCTLLFRGFVKAELDIIVVTPWQACPYRFKIVLSADIRQSVTVHRFSVSHPGQTAVGITV